MTSRKALTRSFEQNGAAGYKKSFAEHQKEIRLEANRRRVAESRTNEPKAVRLRRLADYRERVAKRRASETPEERQQRLENNRRRVAQKRASEDEEQRRTRLEKDRERVARKRALEKTALPPPFGVGLPLITVAKNVTTLPEELEGMSGKSLEPVIIIGSTAISNSTSEPVSVGTNGTTIKGVFQESTRLLIPINALFLQFQGLNPHFNTIIMSSFV